MTKALPFTQASLARAIQAVERAGKFVIGVRPDGTLIVGESPLNPGSILPLDGGDLLASKWEDVQA